MKKCHNNNRETLSKIYKKPKNKYKFENRFYQALNVVTHSPAKIKMIENLYYFFDFSIPAMTYLQDPLQDDYCQR